ncbi:mgmt family protein [Grosmannia clavigera kw1407]|uniref:Mgmt family protein n=1 Tax=Grosmannia clavigera (strain kw1407 / UAMH 11150) TaxID=655863 RepID=F0X7E0_GROCL|nr:mgmt family protein [Grosmannia clavigera kw1407]EFX06524.1 mgmt family protein [Grosmannia clavigera kw1407]
MPRSDEAASFFFAVYAAVSEIPPGRVTTYGHIAALIGMPQRPRQVGICLKHLPADATDALDAPDSQPLRFHSGNVPWQRVLNAKGLISPRAGDGGNGRRRQAEALRAEGVEVRENAGGLGEMAVDLGRFGWFPRQLPSEREGEEDEDGDENDD